MQETWKTGCDFSSLAFHVSHPNCRHFLSSFVPQKSSPYPIFLAASDQKVQPSFPTPFSLFLFSSLFALTRQPSLSHQNKISLSKEEIKGLTLKFQLPRLWVSNQNFICLFLFLYPLS